jgi:hypothetical protein
MTTQQDSTQFVVNGRTLSLASDFDRDILGDYVSSVNVFISPNGRAFVECANIEDAQVLFETFRENDLKPRVSNYSLFFRSTEAVTYQEARIIFEGLTNANIMYMRVDDNNHTGKLVVDSLEEYQALKAYEDNTMQFYHFNPKSRQNKRRQD